MSDAHAIVHQHFHPVGAAVGKQIWRATSSVKHGAKKTSFVAHDKLQSRRLFHQAHTLLILRSLVSIPFVIREGSKTEQAIGNVVGTFGGQKVAVVLASQTAHQTDPLARIAFECSELVRINNVFDVTGNHVISPLSSGPSILPA